MREVIRQKLADSLALKPPTIGEPSSANRLDPSKTAKKSFVLEADGLTLANKLQQKRAAKECADWIERKVDIRTSRQSNLLHGKMYHIANGGVEDASPDLLAVIKAEGRA